MTCRRHSRKSPATASAEYFFGFATTGLHIHRENTPANRKHEAQNRAA